MSAAEAPEALLLPVGPIVSFLREWVSAGNRLGSLPPSQERYARRLLDGEQESCNVDAVDRLLLEMGELGVLGRLYPPPKRAGRAGYTWPKPHPLRRLTTEQIHAAHRLHLAGMSIRELGRQLYERHGYASAKSCATALSEAFARHSLEARDRAEAAAAANRARPGVDKLPGETRNEARRRRRARLRASDPSYHRAELARLAELHLRETRASSSSLSGARP